MMCFVAFHMNLILEKNFIENVVQIDFLFWCDLNGKLVKNNKMMRKLK